MLTDERCIELLRVHGLRATAPRVLVLQALAAATDHLSADEIHATVLGRNPAVSSVTIYRTLETFEETGLVVRGMLGDKVIRWEQVLTRHHHLICSQCGEVVELDDAPFQRLADDLLRQHGLVLEARHLSLRGVCAHCTGLGSVPR